EAWKAETNPRKCAALSGLGDLLGRLTRPFRPGYHIAGFQPRAAVRCAQALNTYQGNALGEPLPWAITFRAFIPCMRALRATLNTHPTASGYYTSAFLLLTGE